jgi:signal transduction histidine kinase
MAVTGPVFNAVLFLTGIATLLAAGIGTFALARRDRNKTITAFAITCLASSLWAGTYLIRLLIGNPPLQYGLMILTFVGITVTPAALAVFVLLYTGNENWVTRKTVAALAVHPAIIVLLLVSNPSHELFYAVVRAGSPTLYREWGPLFWPHIAYSYTLLLVSVAALAHFALTSSELYRAQSLLIFLGLSIPSAANVPFLLKIKLIEGIDPTPASISLGMVAVAGSVFYGRLIEFLPAARATVVENLEEGVLVLDENNRITDANPRAAAVFDTTEDALTQESAANVLPEPVRDLLDGNDDEIEWERKTPEGNEYYRINREQVPAHGVRGTILTISDITESKRRRLQLQAQNEKLDRFARVVSHDLRNPLNVAMAYTEKIDYEDTAADEDVAKIDESLHRMDEIIDDVLRVARAKQDLEGIREVDIETIAGHAWKSIEAETVTLTVEDSGSVLADPGRLQQLFENLFRNVTEHTDAERIWVGIADGELYVEDDGPGIPESEREHVFEEGHTSNEDGTGLGLSIVGEVAAAHDWEISVADGREGGARFVIET